MKIQNKLIVYSLSLFSFNCASLTKSQLAEVNAFGQNTKTFSAYPEKVISTLVDIHTQNQYFQVGMIVDAQLHEAQIDSIYSYMEHSANNNKLIGLVFQIISDYGQKLVHLTADVHSLQLDTAAQSFGANLDGLVGKFNTLEPQNKIPTGYGALIGKVITVGGNIYIHDRQAKGAKAFVAKGDTLIAAMSLELENYLDSDDRLSVKSAIARERKDLVRNYKNFLASNNELVKVNIQTYSLENHEDRRVKQYVLSKKDTVITGSLSAWRSSGMGADSLYLKLMADLDADETLRQQCLLAVKSLRKAHAKLLQDLQQKKDLKEVYIELQDYGTSINQMYSTYKKIK
jgi:hypothetical protein